jgi:hypothetical protein
MEICNILKKERTSPALPKSLKDQSFKSKLSTPKERKNEPPLRAKTMGRKVSSIVD